GSGSATYPRQNLPTSSAIAGLVSPRLSKYSSAGLPGSALLYFLVASSKKLFCMADSFGITHSLLSLNNADGMALEIAGVALNNSELVIYRARRPFFCVIWTMTHVPFPPIFWRIPVREIMEKNLCNQRIRSVHFRTAYGDSWGRKPRHTIRRLPSSSIQPRFTMRTAPPPFGVILMSKAQFAAL